VATPDLLIVRGCVGYGGFISPAGCYRRSTGTSSRSDIHPVRSCSGRGGVCGGRDHGQDRAQAGWRLWLADARSLWREILAGVSAGVAGNFPFDRTHFGGYSFGPLALHGNEILKWGLIHLVLFIFVGFFEEFLFRGYTQYTLGNGIGFWPAAFILSFGFGAVHLSNPGEGWIGAASVVLIGLFFCFTLRRTGSLWYAVGLHASFDWGETFLYSVPNSGTVMQGHLSDSLLHGPKWLTGGTVGPEGSVFCFLTIGLQFLVVMLLFPAKKSDSANETHSLAA
jgi:membrane protease YdiL (CAAX protease family)